MKANKGPCFLQACLFCSTCCLERKRGLAASTTWSLIRVPTSEHPATLRCAAQHQREQCQRAPCLNRMKHVVMKISASLCPVLMAKMLCHSEANQFFLTTSQKGTPCLLNFCCVKRVMRAFVRNKLSLEARPLLRKPQENSVGKSSSRKISQHALPFILFDVAIFSRSRRVIALVTISSSDLSPPAWVSV